MPNNSFCIYAVSDATGRLAYSLAVAASRQFEGIHVELVRKVMINSRAKIKDVVAEAKGRDAVIVFTMVSEEIRRQFLEETKSTGVVAMDVMGPVLGTLSNYFHKLPSNEPGLQYKVTQDYYKRTEAVEFTVRHDDGLGLDDIEHADIILLGTSRTQRTPLSIYLAYQGHRCANVPIVKDMSLPDKIFQLNAKKIVGLIPSIDRLVSLRVTRLKKLGRPDSELYAQKEHIEQEVAYSKTIFEKISGMHVLDMADKAIEEIASEIVQVLSLKKD